MWRGLVEWPHREEKALRRTKALVKVSHPALSRLASQVSQQISAWKSHLGWPDITWNRDDQSYSSLFELPTEL